MSSQAVLLQRCIIILLLMDDEGVRISRNSDIAGRAPIPATLEASNFSLLIGAVRNKLN